MLFLTETTRKQVERGRRRLRGQVRSESGMAGATVGAEESADERRRRNGESRSRERSGERGRERDVKRRRLLIPFSRSDSPVPLLSVRLSESPSNARPVPRRLHLMLQDCCINKMAGIVMVS